MPRRGNRFSRTGKPLCFYCRKLAVLTIEEGHHYTVKLGIVTSVTPNTVSLCETHKRESTAPREPRFQVGDHYISILSQMSTTA